MTHRTEDDHSNLHRPRKTGTIRRLTELEERLVELALRFVPDAREGAVMSAAKAPYRRIDCDGRALAFVHLRTKLERVRVDVSGLWVPPPDLAPIAIRSRSAVASFWIADTREAARVALALGAIVQHTRAHLRRNPEPLPGRRKMPLASTRRVA